MKKKLTLICTLFFMCISLQMYSQTSSVSGTIKDTGGNSLPGSYAMIKGTNTGTAADFDGKYTLNNVSNGKVIVYSFMGMKSQEVVYKGQVKIDVILREDALSLDEVVAIGYGTKKKSVVTGAISSVSSEELIKSKPTNAISALTGRVSGVTVSSASGQPGKSPKLIIRGVGTNGDSNPLYIVDGLPTSDMSYVNPNDIESMEVLKDATSTAIYGARGANGVVLITTKKGKKGKTEISYDGYYGLSKVTNQVSMLNSADYVDMIKEFYDNDGYNKGANDYVEGNMHYPAWIESIEKERDLGYDTDWNDEIFETAPVQEHNITASMGSDKGSCLLSASMLDQKGIIDSDASWYKRYTVRTNAVYDATDYISVGGNFNFIYSEQSGVGEGSMGWNPIYYAAIMDPTTPVSYPEGSEWENDAQGFAPSQASFGAFWNPCAYLNSSNGYGKNHTQRAFGNLFVKIKPIKNLVIKSDFGANFKNTNKRSYKAVFYHDGDNNNSTPSVSQDASYSTMWQWENTINYSFEFGKNNFSVLGGTTAQESNGESMSGSRNYPADEAATNDAYWYLNSGDVSSQINGGYGSIEHTIFSTFGRLSYNYDEKYMTEFVIRRDGSSNFGPNNKYGVFPGVSFGWNVFNEDWWDVKNFDVLKIRASWGQNGNESIAAFQYDGVISNLNYYTLGSENSMGAAVVGAAPENLDNPDVKWETSEQYNLGVDMAFFGGKLRSTIDVYDKNTKDLLLRPSISEVYGNVAAYTNVGEISNKGLEISVSYQDHIGEFNYSVSGNATYLKNNVESVGGQSAIDGGEWLKQYVTRMEEGEPIGYFRLLETQGMFQNQEEINNYKSDNGTIIQPDAQPGDFKFKDANGDGSITDDDRVNCGNPWAKWSLGLNLSANYKNWDISMLLSSKLDFDVFEERNNVRGIGYLNQPDFFLDRWQKQGDVATVPRLTQDATSLNFYGVSDFYLHDASFLKISNLEVGYTFPKEWMRSAHLTKARVYLSVDNLATFTDYPYSDPDVGSMTGDILDTGIDYGKYPQSMTTRVGLSLTF